MAVPRSIMILRPGALGDALLTLPLLRALAAAGARHLTVWGTPRSWAWMNPRAQEVRVLDGQSADWLALFSKDAELSPRARDAVQGIDAAVAFTHKDDPDMRAALKNAGVQEVIFARPPLVGDEARAHASDDPVDHAAHAAARLMQPLRHWMSDAQVVDAIAQYGPNAVAHEAAPPAEWFAADEALTQRVWSDLGLDAARPLLAVHPGSGGKQKCWPATRFIEVLSRAREAFDPQIAALLGPAEDDRAAEWAAAFSSAHLKATLVRERSISDIHALLRRATWYLGNDAGVTHLAAQACPTVALFGPTDPRVWRPVGAQVQVVSAYPGAMEDLTVEPVWDALRHLPVHPRHGA